jgi:hypothetical protein
VSEQAQPPDDLERLLAASRELRARYREASVEEPSSALDDAIRAQARRAVGARPRSAGSPFSSTWRLPLSLAAMLVLSVTLTVMVTRQDQHLASVDESGGRRSAPAAEPSAAAPPPARPPTDEKEGAPMRQEYSRKSTAPAKSEVPRLKKDVALSPEQSAPADEATPQSLQKQAQPFPAPPTVQSSPAQKSERAPDSEPKVTAARGLAGEPARESEAVETDAVARRDRAAEQGRAEVRPPSTANAAQARGKLKAQDSASTREEHADAQSQQPPAAAVPESPAAAAAASPWESNPQEWLRHIERLVRDHRLSEARDSFKAFRQRYPSYPLPSEFPLREP